MNLKLDMIIPKALQSLRGEPHKLSSSWEAQDSGGFGGGCCKVERQLARPSGSSLRLCASHISWRNTSLGSSTLISCKIVKSLFLERFVLVFQKSLLGAGAMWSNTSVGQDSGNKAWKASYHAKDTDEKVVRGHQAPGEMDPNPTSGSLIPPHPTLSVSSPSPAQTCFYCTQ